MTLEGAINFHDTELYTIYTMNSSTAGQYCVVLPKNSNGMYNMLVDLHMKSLFDSVNAGSKSRDELINEISGEYNNIKTKYSDAILVIPMFDEANYINIINTDDKQKMFDEVKKIGAITSELYKKLVDGGLDKSRLDQKIIIVEKNDYDKKFVEWLVGQMPNFVSSVNMNELSATPVNPFVANEPVNNIFGAPVIETPTVTDNVVNNTNVVNEPVVSNNNLFNEQPVAEAVVTSTVEVPVQQPVVESNNVVPNIFGEQSVQQATPVPEPVAPAVEVPVQQPVVEEPKPVQSVELDKTVTFSPVNEATVVQPQQVQQPAPAVTTEAAAPVDTVPATGDAEAGTGEIAKKSNGFVNLAILLVILAGVTLASIELGKFLYNTYGV